MKKQEVIELIDGVKSIKSMTDREEYLVSSAANQVYNKILPILDKELKRLDFNKVEARAPGIIILRADDGDLATLQDSLNVQMHELVLQDYKIIDFGIYERFTAGYIKYTS